MRLEYYLEVSGWFGSWGCSTWVTFVCIFPEFGGRGVPKKFKWHITLRRLQHSVRQLALASRDLNGTVYCYGKINAKK